MYSSASFSDNNRPTIFGEALEPKLILAPFSFAKSFESPNSANERPAKVTKKQASDLRTHLFVICKYITAIQLSEQLPF